ncbi:IS5 family transposase [Tahibacter amnicola]|uniref:IS5 family transposase n=1 Tax=Tahibacter amnicola TaxID=2976241 RepID=A0ABY6BAH2_9GAMM|nr:IS5 family transposase [Tahibacter amnicola]MCU7371038.1 IS5 family transposase [Paucibacter sp. O1-1]MDA3826026.1 IS5 family transposase [Paucibacter sp. O1-1]UXI65912.1 IS5 family transposase [Tahibacter amnicola]UXI65974.1 IS5 family transposase [Tahibacter amnicola]UXI66030.1 IS5 family transposase [Tahibacter amnicola]
MRTPDVQQLGLFSYVSVEARVPPDHPIRQLRELVDGILANMDELFESRYARIGRPSIPPERLLRASLLQVVYSVRSERLLMEQLDYNLLFRWFVGLNIDDRVWDHSTFSFNRDRLFDEEIAQRFFDHTVLVAQLKQLVSNEHFSVDGTLLEAWASHKSFRPKDGDGSDDSGNFHGQKRSNETHESTTDPDARLMRKGAGKEAKLCYQASTLMENRNGLLVGVDVRHATGTSERESGLLLVDEMLLGAGCTLGADKAYDTHAFVAALKERGIKPHVAQNNSHRRSAVDGRTASSKGYAISQRVRKKIEQGFGWVKTIGELRKLTRVGLPAVRAWVTWTFAAYNLIRIGGIQGWWNPSPT